MHRVFCPELPEVGETVQLEEREHEHLFKVLRAVPGDTVEVLDGKGGVGSGTVLSERRIELRAKRQMPEPQLKLHLCCALPRRQKQDQLLKQAAELGAWSIRPMRCTRSVAEGDPRDRWELLLREACKQSGNPFLPRLLPEEPLPETLKTLKAEKCAIYYGAVTPAALHGNRASDQALLIGPEGGFAPEELTAIEKAGATPLNLGPHVLRLETAAICGLSAIRLLASIVLLMLLVVLPSGCKRASIEKNPLMQKADKLREAGDMESARKHYRQVIARYPEEPLPYFALGKLCYENLNDPWEAYFCCRNFLQLAKEDDPQRANVQAYLDNVKKELERLMTPAAIPAAEPVAAASPEIMEQIEELKKNNNKYLTLLQKQEKRINDARKRLAELQNNRSAAAAQTGAKKSGASAKPGKKR